MTAIDLLDLDLLGDRLASIGLGDWPAALEPLLRARMSAQSHGDFARWQAVVTSLPEVVSDTARLRERLLELSPWRKGPFRVANVDIDAEWRSDLKWARIAGALRPLEGNSVLDVGCGNGYYAQRMRQAGAGIVIGIDPTLLYVLQFLAINTLEKDPNTFVLPLRLDELPDARHSFDTTFSMGVLYHQRSPIDHLRQLRTTLRPGGQLLLETLYLPGKKPCARTPERRYARMKNVWLLPTIAELTTWLQRSGYREIEIADQSVTTTEEQRTTAWMPFESLAEALDPDDPTRTVEGWPAPHRVVVSAISP
ncbi:MAG: tRNA 5-methoxyuridine(34)/uridine 5-oxyacetic acid(34) synthase CmoB [Woeseiaceae bacterium]|nr:tRNA 5-methoxyuridine(34)/uridine 5-oxyacetic acid(34) synthase CmoB [Woeseiaceae bacterium]